MIHLRHQTGPIAVGGRLHGIELPTHDDSFQWRDSARNREGPYAKARAGILRELTGISDPYEARNILIR